MLYDELCICSIRPGTAYSRVTELLGNPDEVIFLDLSRVSPNRGDRCARDAVKELTYYRNAPRHSLTVLLDSTGQVVCTRRPMTFTAPQLYSILFNFGLSELSGLLKSFVDCEQSLGALKQKEVGWVQEALKHFGKRSLDLVGSADKRTLRRDAVASMNQALGRQSVTDFFFCHLAIGGAM